MGTRAWCTSLVLAGFIVACDDSPTGLPGDPPQGGEMVITQGIAAPALGSTRGRLANSNFNPATSASLGGSALTPVSLAPQTCSQGSSQSVVVTFSVRGNQANAASFKVNTNWSYNGTSFVGSVPVTVNVPAQSGGSFTSTYPVTIAVTNASGAGSGTTSFVIKPSDISTSGSPPLAYNPESADVTIHVSFVACGDVQNTPPVLTLPADITAEATSGTGAVVSFTVMAGDAEDGDLSGSVTCSHTSGGTFPLGETTVNCSVTDTDGETAQGSFKVKVQDTTAPVLTTFPGNQTLIAANINGAVLDLGTLTMEAKDYGPDGPDDEVSPPVQISCKIGSSDADGYQIAVGQTVTVSCTATDNSQFPSPNTSAASVFDVLVTLDLSCVAGFQPPLRMSEAFSAHKRGSTVPHKLAPPCYSDGSPAVDLASGLRLVLKFQNGGVGEDEIEANDYSAGSTVWRYDGEEGHYVFNLKTGASWSVGTWVTGVSYAGIELAATTLYLKK